jgi:hypothetical protein
VSTASCSYASTSMINYCLPSQNSSFVAAAQDFIDDEKWATAFASIEKAKWIILLSVIVAIIIVFIYLKILQVRVFLPLSLAWR